MDNNSQNNKASFSISFAMKDIDANAKRIGSAEVSMSGETSPEVIAACTADIRSFVEVVDASPWARRLAGVLTDALVRQLEKPSSISTEEVLDKKEDKSSWEDRLRIRLFAGRPSVTTTGAWAYPCNDQPGYLWFNGDKVNIDRLIQLSKEKKIKWEV
jgi:hypothetical protein